jgi:aspartate-semialdehyde dehydrogenase
VNDSRALRVAVIGATGLVGREVVALLEERSFPVGSLALFASPASVGETLDFGEEAMTVNALPTELPEVDLVFLCASAEVSRDVGAKLADGGALVIDLAPGGVDQASLLLGAADLGAVTRTTRGGLWVRVPDPSTRLVVAPLRALGAALEPIRVVATVLLSASAFGRAAVERLSEESIALLNLREAPAAGAPQEAFRCKPLAPRSPVVTRVSAEVAALVKLRTRVAIRAIRVPMFHGHAAALSLEFDSAVEIDRLRRVLREAPSLVVAAEEGADTSMSTLDVIGVDAIHVVGLCQDERDPCWAHFWTLADNVRLGAALAAVSLAEGILLKH